MPADDASEGHPCYLDVTFQFQEATGLLDSWSVITQLSTDFYEKLRRLKMAGPLLPTPFTKPMIDASGNRMEFDGVTEVSLAIRGGKDRVRATVAVRAQADLDALLGTNVLRRNLEFRTALLHVLGGKQPNTFVTLHQVILPPKSTPRVIVFGTFNQSGRYYLHGQHTTVEDGVVDWRPYKTRLPLNILCTNNDERPVVFRPGWCVVKAEPVEVLDPEDKAILSKLALAINNARVATTSAGQDPRLQTRTLSEGPTGTDRGGHPPPGGRVQRLLRSIGRQTRRSHGHTSHRRYGRCFPNKVQDASRSPGTERTCTRYDHGLSGKEGQSIKQNAPGQASSCSPSRRTAPFVSASTTGS